jgi:signal transduction histidine kinase/CheY-like chemotaxis protein
MQNKEGVNYQTVFEAVNEPLAIVEVGSGCVTINGAARGVLSDYVSSGSFQFTDVFEAPGVGDLVVDELILLEVRTATEPFPINCRVSFLQEGLLLISFEDPAKKEKYFHSQRLETLGMLSGGIAHDFNNVLTGLLGHITYLKTILPQSGPHIESLDAIEEGSKKASVMTQEILNFSRLRTVEKNESVDLCELLLKTCGLLRGAFPPAYQLEFEAPESPVCVEGVEGKLAQVFVNLVMNSRAALGNAGEISICLEEGQIEEVAGVSSVAVVKVSDSGEGIPEENLSRIFEPFFSTKTQGTGLGLATVKRIVDESGGDISIESTVGVGTEVSVILPLSSEGLDTIAPLENRKLEHGTERILIVDDEDPVRNVLCVSLKHLGYSVEVARSGQEALAHLEADPNGFDLVILDMLMPELSGDETYFRMRELTPELRALVISGYSSEAAVQKVLDNGGRGFIQKPFSIEQLSAKVRECLIDE